MAKIRKRIGKGPGDYTSAHIHQLRCGHDFFANIGDPAFGDDMAAMRESWPVLREAVLEEHRRRHGLFTRPWGWWEFEAPEPQRLLRQEEDVKTREWILLHEGPDSPKLKNISKVDIYETERNYLIRLGLLTEAERAELGKQES